MTTVYTEEGEATINHRQKYVDAIERLIGDNLDSRTRNAILNGGTDQ